MSPDGMPSLLLIYDVASLMDAFVSLINNSGVLWSAVLSLYLMSTYIGDLLTSPPCHLFKCALSS